MMPERWPGRLVARGVHVLIALAASAAVLGALAFGYGTFPALGPALDPGHGVWLSGSGQVPGPQTLTLPGLKHPVSVTYTRQGVPSIRAADDADAFLALGFLHARFRFVQMDLQRRLGEGRLAQLAGPSAVSSDTFELRLGLLRTAQREWADTPTSSPAGQALIAYSRGVNDYLAQARSSHHWPAVFTVTGVYPRNWTPVDSLVVQEDLTQVLDFMTTPLDYALLERSLGAARTMAWFPVQVPGSYHPYDPGPYRYRGIAPLTGTAASSSTPPDPVGAPPATSPPAAVSAAPAVASSLSALASGVSARVATPSSAAIARAPGTTVLTAPAAGQPAAAPGPAPHGQPVPAATATAAEALLSQVAALPAGQIHVHPDSNAWAANGPAVAGGVSMLAGDPHLKQTVPSIWYQAAISAPGLAVTGVTVPGLPGVLLGHNAHIAWSLTDVQNQSTLFYTEKTSKSRPGQYFWHGAWRQMGKASYTIPVRGGAPVHLTVDLTVHGPVMTQAGQTTSVDWMGDIPSPDIAVMLAVNKASDFAQFHAALAGWRAPAQNFVYADDRGNIGAIAAGYYPLVPRCQPWLPMTGTGKCDVKGVIPYAAVPQVYDPPSHLVVSANQRPVGPSYPYYIGTSAEFFFSPGYRASEITSSLAGKRRMKPAAFASVQLSVTDALAARVVPRLLAALKKGSLPPQQKEAASLLQAWNGSMSLDSAAASVWWTFWTDYLRAVFQPWWTARGVPVSKDRAGLAVSPDQFSLDEVLVGWTEHDPGNAAFDLPSGTRRNAPEVMRQAFATAVNHLNSTLHGTPSTWTWGRLHSRQFPSVTGAGALGYGPRASGGDPWTVDAADGGLVSHAGPSWRMIVMWTGRGSATGEGVYPGGQSGNPASPWFETEMADWWNGHYLPMPPAGGYDTAATRWSLLP